MPWPPCLSLQWWGYHASVFHHEYCLEGNQRTAAEKKEEGKWENVRVVQLSLCHINQDFVEQSRICGVSAAAKDLRLCSSTVLISSVTYLSMSVLMWTRWLLLLWCLYQIFIDYSNWGMQLSQQHFIKPKGKRQEEKRMGYNFLSVMVLQGAFCLCFPALRSQTFAKALLHGYWTSI